MPAQSLPPCRWGRASSHRPRIGGDPNEKTFLDSRLRGNDKLGMEKRPHPQLYNIFVHILLELLFPIWLKIGLLINIISVNKDLARRSAFWNDTLAS